MSTDSETDTSTAVGWPDIGDHIVELVGDPEGIGWPNGASAQALSTDVSRETEGAAANREAPATAVSPVALADESVSRETAESADTNADDIPSTTPGRRAGHARLEADDVPPADNDASGAAVGTHRRFAVQDAATSSADPRTDAEPTGPVTPAVAEAVPESAPVAGPPVLTRQRGGAVRTAAEIAAEPITIGGASDISADETPLAAATGMALRVRGIDRSSPLPRPSATRVMVVANQKGGVGKTTSAVNVAAALALCGSRVLLIDLDPQGNASTALGIEHHAGVPSMYEVLVRGVPIADVLQPAVGIANLTCAPATIDLSGAEVELVALVAREQRLKRAIQAHLASPNLQDDARYDYVLIDCPPSLGLLTVNALAAGVEVFIPIQCEYYALEGVSQLVRIVELVRTQLNPALIVTTVLLTMYDARTRLSSQVADEVRRHFGSAVLATAIPRSVRISEAPSYSQSVMTYDPGSAGALSYLEAAREIAYHSQRTATLEESS